MPSSLPDIDSRIDAVRMTDHNVVVVAGAGTGKTSLLIDRLIHLLFQYPHPVPLSKIVALTFTNKAANEMKVRLRERLIMLQACAASDLCGSPLVNQEWAMAQTNELMKQFQLSAKRLQELANRAIKELERSQIGTIHGFAAHLLRSYPIQSAVDPQFQEDDGVQFSRYFEQEWRLWMDEELGLTGLHHDTWRMALNAMTLEDIKALAFSLTDELIPLDQEWLTETNGVMTTPITEWAMALANQGRMLRTVHEQDRTLERMLDQAIDVLTFIGQATWPIERMGTWLERTIPPKTTTWSIDEYRMAKRIIRIARHIICIKPTPLALIIQHLLPFVKRCRREFIHRGWISFERAVGSCEKFVARPYAGAT